MVVMTRRASIAAERYALAHPEVPPAVKKLRGRRHSMWVDRPEPQSAGVSPENEVSLPQKRKHPEVHPVKKGRNCRVQPNALKDAVAKPQVCPGKKTGRNRPEPELAQPKVRQIKNARKRQSKATCAANDPLASGDGTQPLKGRPRRSSRVKQTTSTAKAVETKIECVKNARIRQPKRNGDKDRAQPEVPASKRRRKLVEECPAKQGRGVRNRREKPKVCSVNDAQKRNPKADVELEVRPAKSSKRRRERVDTSPLISGGQETASEKSGHSKGRGHRKQREPTVKLKDFALPVSTEKARNNQSHPTRIEDFTSSKRNRPQAKGRHSQTVDVTPPAIAARVVVPQPPATQKPVVKVSSTQSSTASKKNRVQRARADLLPPSSAIADSHANLDSTPAVTPQESELEEPIPSPARECDPEVVIIEDSSDSESDDIIDADEEAERLDMIAQVMNKVKLIYPEAAALLQKDNEVIKAEVDC